MIHDVRIHHAKTLAEFWREAIDHGRQHMRTRWPAYKGKVPDQLAADLVTDIHGRGK